MSFAYSRYNVTSICRSHGFSFSNKENQQQQDSLLVCSFILFVYSFWLSRLNFYWLTSLLLTVYNTHTSTHMYMLTTTHSLPLSPSHSSFNKKINGALERIYSLCSSIFFRISLLSFDEKKRIKTKIKKYELQSIFHWSNQNRKQ